MRWLINIVLLIGLQGLSSSLSLPHQFAPIIEDPPLVLDNEMEKESNMINAAGDLSEDDNLLRLGNYLAELLMMPWNGNGLPLLYIEDEDSPSDPRGLNNDEYASPRKRSRYYRKYPWKRQNARQTYDAENRYLCQPSKDDVFRLLVALHETRQGNRGHVVNFCNRKRPASAIFTNIRFLG